MPKITAATLEAHTTTVGGYAYSAAKIDATIAPEQTLFTLCVDESGSVSGFRDELEACVVAIISGCQKDPRKDYMMVRVLAFSDDVREVHGFKPLVSCNLADYKGFLQLGGMTALYEATDNAVNATDGYGQKLKERDRDANAIVVTLTDGCDNRGGRKGLTAKSVGESFARLMKNERVESILPILIGVGMTSDEVKRELARFEVDGGFAQFLAIADTNADTFARIAGFVSSSVSAQSNHINTGGPSKPIDPTGLTF